MRLIDAEKLRAEYPGMPNCYNGFSDSYDKAMIVDMVDEQPTIDAVPVVRCRDCRYMTEHYDTDGNAPYWTCSEWDSGTDYDGYCHYGERRHDATD